MKEVALSTLLDSFGCCKGPVELDSLLHELEETGQPILLYADETRTVSKHPVAIVRPIGQSYLIAELIQRARQAIAEFEQANTEENYYLMTDGGEGVGHAETLCALLREFVKEAEDE